MSGLAFVFPGQGSQFPGMGRGLAERYPEAAAVFREADEALGTPISRACFEGRGEDLSRTETTQPALLAVSVAALRVLEARGIRPSAAAGHSLGEYTAHVAAGTLSFQDAIRTVRTRGRFMQEAVPLGEGSMAAILGLDRDAVNRACRDAARGEVVEAANFNGPGQIVIAGDVGAVRRAGDLALAAGARKVVPLPVSAPFHCALMRPAGERLAPVLRSIPFAAPRFPVFTNVDAAPAAGAEGARDALIRQVASPVRWEEIVLALARAGIGTFVEVGPGKVLAGLARRIRKEITVLPAGSPDEIEAIGGSVGGTR